MIPSITWLRPPDDVDLGSHQVDIWRVFLDLPPDSVKVAQSVLAADELERAARFYFPKDREHFIVTHACLRDVLARYLYKRPQELNFSAGEYGKPELYPPAKVEFNLSHSGGYALIAVVRERNVGIDIERVRQDVDFESIARRNFSAKEMAELMALPREHRESAFFACWTRKEAYIKAHGLGLSLPLDGFDVSLTPNEPALLRATRPDPYEAARWTLLALDVDSGYAGALAVEGAGLEFRYWDWKGHFSKGSL